MTNLLGWDSDVRFTVRVKTFRLMYRMASRTLPMSVALKVALRIAMLNSDQMLQVFSYLERKIEGGNCNA